jgi:hypothetical protein
MPVIKTSDLIADSTLRPATDADEAKIRAMDPEVLWWEILDVFPRHPPRPGWSIHDGDLRIDGDFDQNGFLIIDGDLSVSGLVFDNFELSHLIVLGDMTARDISGTGAITVTGTR